MDCIFCSIAKGEIGDTIFCETEKAVAFLDNQPRVPGHSLVVPKQHVANMLELDKEMLEPLFETVQKTLDILDKTLSPDGFTIGINHGKVSGQAVDHLHIHIFPRFSDDKGGSVHDVVSNPPKESVEEIHKRLMQQS